MPVRHALGVPLDQKRAGHGRYQHRRPLGKPSLGARRGQPLARDRAPGTIIAWAHERFAPDLVLACSFQDIVLVDLAVAVDPGIEVIFLDTEAHFPETLEFVDRSAHATGST